ncbi:MAG: asparagine synthase [Candidatus Omnitrophica bacterium]|nr:asparagine synthase [Candidatus Omnitrophota bacterium]
MSRIIGLIRLDGSPKPLRWAETMLSLCRSRETWRSDMVAQPAARVGWCGTGTAHVSARGPWLIALDGRLYNHRELGPDTSDAACLARLIEERGVLETLPRLNGDFAFAVFDAAHRELWLARDRFGVKPLYYTQTPEWLAFASRPRALLALPGVSREVDRGFVARFAALHYRAIDAEPQRSPYAAIRQVPAAHVVRFAQGMQTAQRYWTLMTEPDLEGSPAQLAERYRALLLDAVSIRLDGAGRCGFTLSGGMDSSSVLACAAHLRGAPQPALSIVYDDATYDESEEIGASARALASPWQAVRVGNPPLLELISELIEAHDEPVATATWLSHALLCREAQRSGIETLFGGLGGDELNAGEYEYFPYFFADLRAAGQETVLQHEIAQWIHHHDHPVFRKTPEAAEAALQRLVDARHLGRCVADHERLTRYAGALNPDYHDLRTFEPVLETISRSYLKNRAYHDLTRETIPCCLRAEDRQAAVYGLGTRQPFLDHRLAEFMFRIPGGLKIREGVTKQLLREAMRGLLPEATRTRVAKTGWNAPAHVWFSGPAREPLGDLIRSSAFRRRGIYNTGMVERLFDEHEAIVRSGRPQAHHMMFFWQLVNLELWLQWLEHAPFNVEGALQPAGTSS